jgi:hypothetical protein
LFFVPISKVQNLKSRCSGFEIRGVSAFFGGPKDPNKDYSLERSRIEYVNIFNSTKVLSVVYTEN